MRSIGAFVYNVIIIFCNICVAFLHGFAAKVAALLLEHMFTPYDNIMCQLQHFHDANKFRVFDKGRACRNDDRGLRLILQKNSLG